MSFLSAFVELALAGATSITIINRKAEKAQELADSVQNATGVSCQGLAWDAENIDQAVTTADIIINTTPIGMYPHHQVPSVIPTQKLQPEQLVCDLIYNPLATTLLQEAKQMGCKVLSGLGMLLYQGALGYKLWTQAEPPVVIMQGALQQELSKKL